MTQHVCEKWVGSSAAAETVLADIDYAAPTDAKILITGESGVGKEIVARLVHAGSRRKQGPFVTVNCAGLTDTLLESELFGHVRGSFTGAYRDHVGVLELAHGGTLFLDEIGEMTLRMQAVLLRFLETGEIQRVGCGHAASVVNVRLVTATNRELLTHIKCGAFREDLYYRLNVVHITIPPLRERRDDVPELMIHYLARFAADYGVAPPLLSDEAMAVLKAYEWPGNVRELRNVAEQLVVRVHGSPIRVEDLPAGVRQHVRVSPGFAARSTRAEAIYARLVHDREVFWSVVYEPFMRRDMTREDLREIVARGLEDARGSYTNLVHLFNLDSGDYKRLLNFLHTHGCYLPVRRMKAGELAPPKPERRRASIQPGNA